MEKNKPYTFTTEDGKTKTLYDGRYACVCAMVIAEESTGTYILANKRGPGCPNEIGKWNMPCGYMDAGTAPENCSKEVFEETGIQIAPSLFCLIGVGDTERNVTLRYEVRLPRRLELASIEDLKGLGGEENEVSEIKWINIEDVDNYQWAFDHDQLIKKVLHFEALCK